jgi:hypothetical protein
VGVTSHQGILGWFYKAYEVEAAALNYLGLAFSQSVPLFYHRWPGRFGGYDFGGDDETKQAIALLDAMVTGEVTLSDAGIWTDHFAETPSP